MESTVGEVLRITLFGESHGSEIGVTIDGFPAGLHVDEAELKKFLERRAPGRDPYSTPRREDDEPEFLSGIENGVTAGTTIKAVIRNKNVMSGDYDNVADVPRPSHADYTSYVKYGRIAPGGGHFSGRLTAPLCIAGCLAKQLLEKNSVSVTARAAEIGGVCGSLAEMKKRIAEARKLRDSVGGIVECTASGVPAGIGDPMFDGIENRISRVVFGIPAVRGIEFGAGFAAARMRGSEHNDPFTVKEGKIITTKNDHGGILGGITSGMPVVFRVAIKPTPSIGIEQDSVSLSRMTPEKLTVKGRHDPCIVLRAVPAVEAACAIAILDAMLADCHQLKTE